MIYQVQTNDLPFSILQKQVFLPPKKVDHWFGRRLGKKIVNKKGWPRKVQTNDLPTPSHSAERSVFGQKRPVMIYLFLAKRKRGRSLNGPPGWFKCLIYLDPFKGFFWGPFWAQKTCCCFCCWLLLLWFVVVFVVCCCCCCLVVVCVVVSVVVFCCVLLLLLL